MVQLVFYGSEKSETDSVQLKAFCNTHDEIYIEIKSNDMYSSCICLNKETAIKFSRELRKQIARIEDEKSI